MITKVKTENGDCWAIVLHQTYRLEDIRDFINAIFTIMKYATYSNEMLPNTEIGCVLSLLDEMLPTPEQTTNYEHYLNKK